MRISGSCQRIMIPRGGSLIMRIAEVKRKPVLAMRFRALAHLVFVGKRLSPDTVQDGLVESLARSERGLLQFVYLLLDGGEERLRQVPCVLGILADATDYRSGRATQRTRKLARRGPVLGSIAV
jgi:hypothetical protein